jgi:DNA (cytosine-5)-methyltransferase 1
VPDAGDTEGQLIPALAGCQTAREGRGPDSDATTTLIAFNARQDPTSSAEVFDPLGAKDLGHGLAVPEGVRRLTPRECERLQGFPDDYTQVPHRGKPAADGPRYKALGNSMAVPVMAWIGRRIAAVDAIP